MKALRIRNKKNVCFVPYANCQAGRNYIVNCAKEKHGEGLSYGQVSEVEFEPKLLKDKTIEFGALVPRIEHWFK